MGRRTEQGAEAVRLPRRGPLSALRGRLRAPLERVWAVGWFVVLTGGGFMGSFLGVALLISLLSDAAEEAARWPVVLALIALFVVPFSMPILVVPTLQNLSRRGLLWLFGALRLRARRMDASPWPRKAPRPMGVEGVRADGVEVRLTVESTPLGAGRDKQYEAWGALSWSARAPGHGVGGFTARREGLLAELRGGRRFDIRGRGGRGQAQEQGAAVERVLERLLVDLGYAQVSVSGAAASAGKPMSTVFDLRPGRLREVADLLAELLRLCAGREVELAGVSVKGRVWTGGEEGARCPYCHDGVDLEAAGDEAPTACEGCGTVHHAACLVEAGGCTIFGCGRRRARVAASEKGG